MNPLLTALVAAGLLTQAEADAIARNLDPQQARAYAENVLGQAFQNGLSAQQRRILGVVDSAEGNPTQAELNRFWAGEDELLWQSVRGSILDIASERATVATIQAGRDDRLQLSLQPPAARGETADRVRTNWQTRFRAIGL